MLNRHCSNTKRSGQPRLFAILLVYLDKPVTGETHMSMGTSVFLSEPETVSAVTAALKNSLILRRWTLSHSFKKYTANPVLTIKARLKANEENLSLKHPTIIGIILSETWFQAVPLHNPLAYASQRRNILFNADLEQIILAAGQLHGIIKHIFSL